MDEKVVGVVDAAFGTLDFVDMGGLFDFPSCVMRNGWCSWLSFHLCQMFVGLFMYLGSCELRKVFVFGFDRNCTSPRFLISSMLSVFILFNEPLFVESLVNVGLFLGRWFSSIFEFLVLI